MHCEAPIIIDGDHGPEMRDTLRGKEGMIQGSPEGPAGFAIAYNSELARLAGELQKLKPEKGGDAPAVKSGADDTFLLGPPAKLLPPLMEFRDRIKDIRLKFPCTSQSGGPHRRRRAK